MFKFNIWDCEIVKHKYSNGRTALQLVSAVDVDDVYKGEPIATATVNIPEMDLKENEVIIKDYSENEGMLEALVAAGIVVPTGRFVDSGFVTCPICILNP